MMVIVAVKLASFFSKIAFPVVGVKSNAAAVPV